MSLAWPRPLYNGGAPILSYKVEAWLKCEDAMGDMVSVGEGGRLTEKGAEGGGLAGIVGTITGI